MLNKTKEAFDPKVFINDLDRSFYRDFDPFYFWTLAECIHSSSPSILAVEDTQTGADLSDHELVKKLEKSRARYSKYSSFSIRAQRYFSSETLILLLLSGRRFGPFARLTSVLQGHKLNGLFSRISERKVPKDFEIFADEKRLSFQEWVSALAFDDRKWIQQNEGGDLVELVVEEAEMLRERGAINAYKHGKTTSYGSGGVLKNKDSEGVYKPVNSAVEGINWLNWFEKKGSSLELTFGTEELSPKVDLNRILSTAIFMDAICETRMMQADGIQLDEVHLPTDFEVGKAVKRQRFSFKFSGKKD